MAAAFCMGAVGIWSMHFIGNNSLKLSYHDSPDQYQLDYSPGYTFASLFVAIGCMFIAFGFVGITEKAHYARIITSGIVAGCGIGCMHYLGQFAIRYFILEYDPAYVVGAILIACAAVTIALSIFFKLREKWANQWYKRLGCAMLMAVAVTGMHYTAMAGTQYRRPAPDVAPPIPTITTAALIGIIVVIVVLGCLSLLYLTVFRYRKHQLPLGIKTINFEKTRKRLLLQFVLFDSKGHILVENDGVLPARLVMDPFESLEGGDLSTSHPLFLRLFETTKQWSLQDDTLYSDDPALHAYLHAAQRIADGLKLGSLADLGMLFDTVIHAQPASGERNSLQRTPSAARRIFSRTRLSTAAAGNKSFSDMEMQLDHSSSSSSSSNSSSSDDQHIFLVRLVGNDKDLPVRLLSRGYRFSDPTFIARIMGAKLRLSTDTMLDHFRDMQYMADLPAAPTMWTTPCTREMASSYTNSAPSQVYVGLMVLVDNGNDLDVIVDKQQRFSFPVVPLDYGYRLEPLGDEEKACVANWRAYSLDTVSSLATQHVHNTDDPMRRGLGTIGGGSTTDNVYSDDYYYYGSQRHQQQQAQQIHRFVLALGEACNHLMDTSSYGRALGSIAKLHGDVLEIPSFALTADSCELILFRAFVNPSTTDPAVIHALKQQPIKGIPLRLYKSLACHVTDQAVELYRHGRRSGATDNVHEREALDMPVMVMPSQARFLWLDLIVEETVREHGKCYKL
ncbi:mhyt domain signaling [Lichtheimia corymbifera JMRC:FSU:9682]|uniref:Mhyt domain signaling n=1 Tax=Lichtheimia corymbifera JMRC:FSU:9682 TaxID=1263082 RepID=A0A068SDG0_9FUNG|nr:mhyt domain signaling [Lichtheimia corymbifera JMRC:FSU:9682]